jgi:hypothetical protein
MEQSSIYLPQIASVKNGYQVYFLTGKRYLYQTLFCIQSLSNVSSCSFQFILVDDGSFTETIIDQIKKQLPGAEIITQDKVDENLKKVLPVHEFPILHHKRKIYPHIKKLTDIHTIPGNDWKLVFDSDMLFWEEPEKIIEWLRYPTAPLHMIDCTQSYGYKIELLEKLCKSKIKPLINVGVIGLKSETINWADLENWIEILEQKEGPSYYLEQALTAMLIGNCNSVELDIANYIVNPSKKNIEMKKGALHHYVDLSKMEYYSNLWRNFI